MGVVVDDLACAKIRSLRGGLPWTTTPIFCPLPMDAGLVAPLDRPAAV